VKDLSVIIPTWREAPRIARAVAAARAIGDEVIVADAASPDATAELAQRAGARVVIANKGRGEQLHAGALAARCETLLFIHADAHLPESARAAIARELASEQVQGGNFYLRFTPETRAARFFTVANHLRRRWLRVYYGDSALFIRRSAYQELGGFPALPVFEDYELVRRLERKHSRARPTAYIRDVEVSVSARRFEHAPLRTLVLWGALQLLYSAGVPAARLAALYRDLRPNEPTSR
jgi:rSAM/selenodomain-associated transferase 2